MLCNNILYPQVDFIVFSSKFLYYYADTVLRYVTVGRSVKLWALVNGLIATFMRSVKIYFSLSFSLFFIFFKISSITGSTIAFLISGVKKYTSKKIPTKFVISANSFSEHQNCNGRSILNYRGHRDFNLLLII